MNSPAIDWSQDSVFLEVDAGTDSTTTSVLSPRSVLTSSPYALVSEFADSTIHWLSSSVNSSKRRGGIIIDSGPGVTVTDNGADSIRISFAVNTIPCGGTITFQSSYPMANKWGGGYGTGTTIHYTVPVGKVFYLYGMNLSPGSGSVLVSNPPSGFSTFAFFVSAPSVAAVQQFTIPFNPPLLLPAGAQIATSRTGSGTSGTLAFWGWEGTP